MCRCSVLRRCFLGVLLVALGCRESAQTGRPAAPDVEATADAGAIADAGIDVATPIDAPSEEDTTPPEPVDTTVEPDPGPAEIAEPPVVTFDPGAFGEDDDLFDQGVRSGDPLPDGALLWTRYRGDAPLELVVFESAEGDGPFKVAAKLPCAPGTGDAVIVHVTGLAPDTRYRFAMVAAPEASPDVRSEIGTFRTAPLPDALVPVTFGGTHGTKQLFRPFHVLERAAEDDLSFFLLAGDTTYADGASTPESYREKWAENMLDPGYRALSRAASYVSTWDDHEVENNYDPETIAQAQLAAAVQVFAEELPVTHPNGDAHLWRSLRYGKGLEVFVLDCRTERKPSTLGKGDAEYLSAEQMAWLQLSLEASTASFKVILNSVPITEFPLVPSAEDRWQGYEVQRQEILEFISSKGLKGVIWITGDFHFGAVMHVGPPGTPEHAQRELMIGPAGQFPNPLWLLLDKAPNLDGQFPFVTGTLNYARMTADPTVTPPTFTVEFVDEAGTTFHSEVLSP